MSRKDPATLYIVEVSDGFIRRHLYFDDAATAGRTAYRLMSRGYDAALLGDVTEKCYRSSVDALLDVDQMFDKEQA